MSKTSKMCKTSDISKITELPHEINVQAVNGGPRLVDVPAQHASSGETD